MSKREAPPLGAHSLDDGVQFAVYAEHADAVDLCLYDAQGHPTQVLPMPDQTDGVWHGFVPNCGAGQHYGYRAHGPYSPEDGHRFDPTKLLIDPYARQLSGIFRWTDELFSSEESAAADPNDIRFDSARYVPKSVVTSPNGAQPSSVKIPWADMVIYETNVRGHTMLHPDVPERDRGRFAGMTHGAVLEYLKALGITSVELLPVHYFVDEYFLPQRGLVNYWGYNTVSFFAPMDRYAGDAPRAEFVDMVNTIHDAGLEVILDVVYNHTAEGNENGPTLSFRGLNNSGYYRLVPDDKRHYINDTGCGNTVDINDPATSQLVLDSLRYFADDLQIDGFRFDLAPILGRHPDGFSPEHPFFQAIATEPTLKDKKMIAEPWDVGPGGYQLGRFPKPWAEWNDQYRDDVREFWRGETPVAAAFARRLHGSSDLFEHGGRTPAAGINLIAAHDGFTLRDVVSYEHKHNEANLEDNRDGHNHNLSRNYGVEGETDDKTINAVRRRQRLNMLATLLWSQGTPMILGGDEFGRTQRGNNNAYAQDNDTTWLDWSLLEDDPAFVEQVRTLLTLRRDLPLLRKRGYVHGLSKTASGLPNIEWLNPDGTHLQDHQWPFARALTLTLRHTNEKEADVKGVALYFNGSDRTVKFAHPEMEAGGEWHMRFTSDPDDEASELVRLSCALWTYS